MNTHDATQAVSHWPFRAINITRLGLGNINQTYRVETPTGPIVLQRVNAIFSPEIHHNIHAVTLHLAQAGMLTYSLIPTRTGALWVDLGKHGVWRCLTWLPGHVLETSPSEAQCQSLGEFLARTHNTLESIQHTFVGMRTGIHQTAKHRQKLQSALTTKTEHSWHHRITELARNIENAFAKLLPVDETISCIGHGDAKYGNAMFNADETCIALIDLDTVGPIPILFELGDALRSWCASGHEDASLPIAFRNECFDASLRGYTAHRSSLLGMEVALRNATAIIALELSCRFATDTLETSYFAWDNTRFTSASEHHFIRAQRQYELGQSIINQI